MKDNILEMKELLCESINGKCNGYCENCNCEKQANALYNTGYRKQKEGEWVWKDGFLVCSECESTKPIAFHTPIKITYYKCDFCNKCGAQMKGGAE